MTQRRNKKDLPEQGGWNLFITLANGLAGWPCDEKLEALRQAWWEEPDAAQRRALLEQVHARAFEVLPYVNGGQFRTLSAIRANVEGVRATTIPVFWNVRKQ